MLARIVEDWLTSAGERGYEAAFAQLLTSEGYRVLQAPVHHPFEHGKDLVATASDGALHAFQLKGGDIRLSSLEAIQGQLLTLSTTAVRYPGVEPPRLPDRAFLVTSGRLTPPARDRLASMNDATRAREGVPVEVVELDQLVSRFVSAHSDFLPGKLEDLSQLLRFVLDDGTGPFPIRRFCEVLKSQLASEAVLTGPGAMRTLAAATILTSYSVGPWQRAENHLAVAEAWLSLALTSMWAAEVHDLKEEEWLPQFELARDTARQALASLLAEAHGAEDLVVPDMVDGMVYPARATLVCGYLAAFFISERVLGGAEDFAESVRSVLLRELPYLKVMGEAQAGLLLASATALHRLECQSEAATLATLWVRDMSAHNAPGSDSAIADPYHSIEELLLVGQGEESDIDEEEFAGQSYTLHVFIEWLARRGARPILEQVWPAVTRIHHCELLPSEPHQVLSVEDTEGEHHTWAPGSPQSWAELRRVSSTMHEEELPQRLWRNVEMLPYLPLLFPHRMTSRVAKGIDYMAGFDVSVDLLEKVENRSRDGSDVADEERTGA